MKVLSTESSLKRIGETAGRGVLSSLRRVGWEKAILAVLIVTAPFLAFYNLGTNPRPWHDEGSYLSLAKTLVQDGVYAVRSAEGYQTFGAVQSVGPTVLLPIALSFKLWGVGLLQGRVVAAIFLLLTLAIFYASGHILFGRRTALFAVILLLASQAVWVPVVRASRIRRGPSSRLPSGRLVGLGARRSDQSLAVVPGGGAVGRCGNGDQEPVRHRWLRDIGSAGSP